jgi:hypothetical protein
MRSSAAAIASFAAFSSPSTGQVQPIFLSAQQFVDVRFAASVAEMRPVVRNQLRSTNPNARSDRGPINWGRAPFRIVPSGRPALTFENIRWTRRGVATPPTSGSVAAEAYFNCTSQVDIRELTQSDVRTSDAESTRTRGATSTDRVRSYFKLTYEPISVGGGGYSVSGGLGGEAGREFENTVVRSNEFVTRTRETRVVSENVRTQITIPPLSLRFFEYVGRSEVEEYLVVGDAVIDVPIRAVFTRPAYQSQREIRLPAFAHPNRMRMSYRTILVDQTVAARSYNFEIGSWSYYYPSDRRTIQQQGIVTIQRESTVPGAFDVTFPDTNQCWAARQEFLANSSSASSLMGIVQRYVQVSR